MAEYENDLVSIKIDADILRGLNSFIDVLIYKSDSSGKELIGKKSAKEALYIFAKCLEDHENMLEC